MFSTESGLPFIIVMVVMVGIASSLQKEIPICEPPAPSCSLFQRTVCEWSDADEPVWACRGFFESATDGSDTAQDTDPDVVLGSYEYQLPQVNVTEGSSKQDSEDSDETDVKYVTFTYPIAAKVKKNGASQVESKSEVRVESSVNTSSARSSSASKSESGSQISIGTYSLPVSSSKSSVAGETGSNVKFETHSRKTATATNTLISTVDNKHSNVESKTNSENLLSSTRTNDVVSEGSGSTAQAAVAEDQTSKNSTVAHEKSTSSLETKKSSSSAGKVDEANTPVRMDTVKYEALAEDSKSTSREEPTSGSKNIESESESSVLGARNYTISSDKQISSSQKENHSSIQSVALSTGNGIDVLPSSLTVLQADTLTSSTESTTSLSNSEDDVQFGTHQVSSGEKSSAKRDDHQSVTSDSASGASTEVQTSSEVAFTGSNPGTSDHRRQYSESAGRSVVCEQNQEQRIQTNQAPSVQGLQSSSMFDDTRRSLASKNLDSQTNWGSYYQRSAGYDSALANQQLKSWMNKYAWAYRHLGAQDFTGNAEYVRNGQWSLGSGYESPGGSTHNENHGVVSADYHNTATDYNIARHYQQYQSNSAGGSGMASQFGDSVARNRFPLSYPYYGYRGYQSSQQAYPAPSTQFGTSGNDYPWPLSWGPQPNSAAYGWMGLNTIVASQSESPSVNSGLYKLQNLNPGSEKFAILSSNSALYAMPYAQHVIASLCPCCEFCKKLMSIFGGTAICDALQPIILECYSKMLEVIRNRLNLVTDEVPIWT